MAATFPHRILSGRQHLPTANPPENRESLKIRDRSTRQLCVGSIDCMTRLKRRSPVAGWSSLVAREAHNLEVVGSNPAPATEFERTLGFPGVFSFPGSGLPSIPTHCVGICVASEAARSKSESVTMR